MNYKLELEINQEEKQIKVRGEYEPSAFLAMCFAQTLQIMTQDLNQAKEYNKTLKKKKINNPQLRARMGTLAMAVQELTKIVDLYDVSMWHINERLEKGEKLEDIMNEGLKIGEKVNSQGLPEMKVVKKDETV